jgi:hypothetical protein
MLGAGFPSQSVDAGLGMGADAIAIDGGSTDSGPYYLGTGSAKSSASAVERALRILLVGARRAGIPLIVGSCGTAGTDSGVDWVAEIVERIAGEERLSFRMARIYSELSHGTVLSAVEQGRIRPLPPAGPLGESTVRSCEHIVGLMGHEPIQAALDAGAGVVLAGRATDTAMVAAVALRAGLAPGPTWHAAKTVECGALCTTKPGPGGVFVEIDNNGFTVVPLAADAACTPTTVAAHMLYENADPFRLIEPTGVLDTSAATYVAIDERSVRVEGSRFENADRVTIKLEGARLSGYETIALVGIRDPEVLSRLDVWVESVRSVLQQRVQDTLGLEPEQYALQLRRYGYDAILGNSEPPGPAPKEVCVLFKVRAADQATATAIAKTANPLLLHMPLPGMQHLPSFAFATSPAELERGAVHEFVLNHVMEVDGGTDLFRTKLTEVGRG